jgi:hypothetical protein
MNKYFYFMRGFPPDPLNGKTVTDLRLDGSVYTFKVVGDQAEHESYYPWVFWIDTQESRSAFAEYTRMLDESDRLRREIKVLIQKHTVDPNSLEDKDHGSI